MVQFYMLHLDCFTSINIFRRPPNKVPGIMYASKSLYPALLSISGLSPVNQLYSRCFPVKFSQSHRVPGVLGPVYLMLHRAQHPREPCPPFHLWCLFPW